LCSNFYIHGTVTPYLLMTCSLQEVLLIIA
jgi:hypothetical protein